MMSTTVKIVLPTLHKNYVRGISKRIAERYGGCTIRNSEGWWKGSDGELMWDAGYTVECIIARSSSSVPWGTEDSVWWKDLAREVAIALGEECVLLSVTDYTRAYFVKGDK